MCDKVVDNYPHALKFVPDCYMAQNMRNKTVNTHHSTIQLVPECYKTQTRCDKAVNRCFLYLILFMIGVKLKKCDRVVSGGLFFIVYCPGRYKAQRMSDESVDDILATLKFIPDWFVTSKILEKSDIPLHANNDMVFYNEDSD